MEPYHINNGEESWKRLYLSKGGKLTLLRSTLSSLPTYYLSLLTISQSMATRLEIIQRNFLWGTSEDEFKYPLVARKKVCLLVEASGLGIQRIGLFNQALLGKWLWYFGIEVNFLWHQLIAKLEGDGALELLKHMAVGCGRILGRVQRV